MLNNSFTKTNTIFGQALGCTALDDAFVKLLSDVNADGVTQFLVRTNGEEKMKTVAQINSESLEAGVRERIFDKVSPKYGTPTYWDTSTNIYFSINTFHPQVAGFCSRFVLCNIYKTFFRSRHQFYRLMPGEGVRIADNESMGENPNT